MESQGLGNSLGFREFLQLLVGKKGEHFRNSPAAFYFYIISDSTMSNNPESQIQVSGRVTIRFITEKRKIYLFLHPERRKQSQVAVIRTD